MNRVIFSFVVMMILSSIGFAKEKFVLEKGTISVDVPKDWQTARDLFGIPLTFLGPKIGGARPIVSITPTGLHEYKFDQKLLEKNQDEYKAGRENWLRAKDGKAIKYFPYKYEHRKDGVDVHQIGYAYEIGGLEFLEYSYFILCGENLYHAKVLLRQLHEKNYEKVTEQMIGSFDCK